MKKYLLAFVFLLATPLAGIAQPWTINNNMNSGCDLLIEVYCIPAGGNCHLLPNGTPPPPGGVTLAPTSTMIVAGGTTDYIYPCTDPLFQMVTAFRIKINNPGDPDCDYWIDNYWFGDSGCIPVPNQGNSYPQYPKYCDCGSLTNLGVWMRVDGYEIDIWP